MSEETHFNGNGRMSTHPHDVYTETRKLQKVLSDEADGKLEALRTYLEGLRKERRECMHAASDHAGTLGLVYRPETNDYVRLVASVPRQSVPERPRRPEPPVPAPAPLPRVGADQKRGFGHYLAESVHWLLAIPVGMFVGYGLGTLTGLPIQRQPALLVMALVIGVCAVFGTKVFLGKQWHMLGQQKSKGELTAWNFWGGVLVSLAVCGVEASLGAMALVIYSSRVAFEESQRIGYAIALPMAVAISTCVLLVSAFSGYHHGRHHMNPADDLEQMNRHQEEEHRRQAEFVESQHRVETEEWQHRVAAIESNHAAELQRIQEEREMFENPVTGADFQALLKYIGRIGVINDGIAEAQAEADSLVGVHGRAIVY